MSACPAPPAGSALSVKRPQNAPVTDGLQGLPSEILLAALECLPQRDLRRAASVSRRLRAAAQDAGLYLHRSISWQLDGLLESHVAELSTIIAHISEYGCRLGIDFSYDGYVPTPSEINQSDVGQAFTRRMRELAKHVLSIISSALPYLVFLRLTLPNSVYTELDTEMRHPAPHLHTFELLDCGVQGMLREAPHASVPQDLFSGRAPRLRKVALGYVSLPPAPIPAFACVTKLHLQYEDLIPSVRAAHHFPRLRDLTIEYLRESPPPPLEFDLRGLILRRLVIDTNDDEYLVPYVRGMLDLAAIPVLERQCDAGRDGITLDARGGKDDDGIGCAWPATPSAELCARFSESATIDEDVNIVVAPRHNLNAALGLRRTFRLMGWELDEPSPLIESAPGLTYLRLDNKYLAGLMHGRGGPELPSLRELRIDLPVSGQEHAEMLWPPAWGVSLGAMSTTKKTMLRTRSQKTSDKIAKEDPCRVSCPELDVLTIFAIDAPMRVDASEALQLGRALGHRARARLVLCGVTFHDPSAKSEKQQQDSMVEQEFCAVQLMPFVGGFPLKERDDDIWSY